MTKTEVATKDEEKLLDWQSDALALIEERKALQPYFPTFSRWGRAVSSSTLKDHALSCVAGVMPVALALGGASGLILGGMISTWGFTAGSFIGTVMGIIAIPVMAISALIMPSSFYTGFLIDESPFFKKHVQNFRGITVLTSFVLSIAAGIHATKYAANKYKVLYEVSQKSCPTPLAPSAKPSFLAAATQACSEVKAASPKLPTTPRPGG